MNIHGIQNRLMNRYQFVALMAAAAVVALAGAVRPAQAELLSHLIENNGSIPSGDKLFDDFEYTSTGDMPDASRVNVRAIQDPVTGDYGLTFEGGFADLQGGGSSDAVIRYRVTVQDPSQYIVGVHMAGNPAVVGGDGAVSVTETFLPTDPNTIMAIFDNSPGDHSLLSWAALDEDQRIRTLHVQKDIFANAANEALATISFIDQTFEQVPEPATTALMLLGAGGMGLVFGRRRSSR